MGNRTQSIMLYYVKHTHTHTSQMDHPFGNVTDIKVLKNTFKQKKRNALKNLDGKVRRTEK